MSMPFEVARKSSVSLWGVRLPMELALEGLVMTGDAPQLGRVHTTTNQIRHLGDPGRVAGIRMTPSYVDLALRVISVNRP